jgi:Nuclease-related domain
MQILIGEPVKGTEAKALRSLYQAAEHLDGLLLVNFYLGPRQIDFILVLATYSVLIELKSLAGAAFGGQNGNWSVVDFTGEKKEYPGLNPWSQAVSQSNELRDELARYQKSHSGVPAPPNGQFYGEFATIACIYPTLHPDSKIEVTSFKAKVMGFDVLIAEVTSQRKNRSWQISDWERFAKESLNLKSVPPEEAIDQRVHHAQTAVNSYRQRLKDFYGHQLAPLPGTTTESIRGVDLIHRLEEPQHQILVGPSGSCKSFHLRHLVVSLASSGNEVPIPIDPKGYDGGELSQLLQRSTSPFAAKKVEALIGDMATCGLQPVLIIDALNECPETSRTKLIEKLQAFVLQRAARLVMADQARVELPPEIKATSISVELPAGDEKVQIFSHYVGEPSKGLAYLSQTFTNAFDLKIAGMSHARGDHPASRWELYNRYVRDRLERTYIVASAFLRAIAGEMMESLTMAIKRDRFEKLAEKFYQQEQTPLAAVEQLLQSRLVLAGDEYVFFEHELLLDFFKTQYLTRKTDAPQELASDLSRPRNAHLLELAMAQCETEAAVEALLAKADDPKPLGLALRGHCGPLAQTVVRKQCLILIALGISQISTIKLTCDTIDRDDGTKALVGFNIAGPKPLSTYGAVLCTVAAENLDDEDIQREFLKLLEVTDTTFKDAVKSAAEEAGIGVRSAHDEALRLYGGYALFGNGAPFVCAGIMSAIRYSRMMSRQKLRPLPILHGLVNRVRADGTRYFSFFTLLIDLQRESDGLEFDDLLDLAQKAWNTRMSWLRTEGVRMLTFLHLRASTLGENQVARIKELLQGFETNDPLVNTEIVEALAAYDGIEPPVPSKDAVTEMRKLIEATDEPTVEQAEYAALFEMNWAEYRRDAACSVLSKIFEDIFMGAYWEAYGELSVQERKKLLELAAMCSRPGSQIDWILSELLPISDEDTLPVFRHYATEMDKDTPFTQHTVGAFMASVRGYARLREDPPPIADDVSDDRKAWCVVGSILFWSLKGAVSEGDRENIEIGWKTLSEELPLCFPDIIEKINGSQSIASEHSISLVKLYPEQVRPILETALQNRASLSSLFRHGGSANERVVQTIIWTLEEIGNIGTIAALETVAEDSKFGQLAVRAIHAIRRRL